jgi:hypothetical protein
VGGRGRYGLGDFGGGKFNNCKNRSKQKSPLKIKKRCQGKVLGDLKKSNAFFGLTSKLGFAYDFDIDGHVSYKIGCEEICLRFVTEKFKYRIYKSVWFIFGVQKQ